MKNAIKLLTLLTAGVSMIFLNSCGKDEGSITPISIDFSSTASTVAENAGAQTVTVLFDAEAPIDATFDIAITGTAVYGTDFTTTPDGATGTANVEVKAGDASATFTFTPIDNENVDGDKTVIFTITGSADGVELGTSLVHTVTIDDEEGPSNVDFAIAEEAVSEDNGALTVTLSFGTTTSAPGTVDVTMTGDVSAVSSDPAAVADVITVSSASGVDEVTFTVTPINDTEFSGTKSILFTLGNATNGIELGSTQQTYELTITEDDPMPISSLRTEYATNGEQTLTSGSIVGVITSVKSSITSQNIVIQDASAGIVVRFNESNVDFDLGDELSIQLAGGSLADFNDLVQISNLELSAATELGVGTLPEPAEITLEQLNTDAYQAQLVTITGLSFVDADGTETLSGNQDVSDGTNTGVVRTESYAPFSGELVPFGTGAVTGIAGVFRGTAQVLPRQLDDIFESMPTGTITVTQSLVDFGEVANGESSATAQVYTVQSTGLTENLSISSSNSSFKLSLDETTFSSSLDVDFNSTNSGSVNVYIEFSPSSGVNVVHSGTITHSSAGTVPVSFDVSGTETGNGAAAATGTELYFSEYAEGSSNNKYVEIYNPTANAIDLSDYQLWGSNNGGDWKAERKLQLEGTIAAGDVFIVAADQADATILAETDMARAYESPVHHNGDDAHGLFKSDGAGGYDLIDVIGVPTVDPGSSWDVAGVTGATANHTLVRKSSISGGNTDWAASAGTTTEDSEWVVKDQDDWTDIGKHTTTADPID